MSEFKLNWKPSPYDSRDLETERPLKLTAVKIPVKFELPIQVPIYDQKTLGSCTSNSGCVCYRYEVRERLKDFEPSRLFLYYNTRVLEGTQNEDSGAYIRDVFKSLSKSGLAAEKTWPYDINKFTQQPPTEAFDEGRKHLVTKYAKVKQTRLDIQSVLLSGACVSFGFTVYESFMSGKWASKTGKMPIPKKGEEILGGHAVTIIGWDNRRKSFLIQNSWGESWGQNGKFWMPYTFLLDSDMANDFWCIEEISEI